MKLKQCEIVNDLDKMTVDIEKTCNKYKTIKQWAYILHDKDDTRPHYHIYLNFGSSSVDTSMVAGWFNLADNFVNRVKGRKADMLKYLTHSNESQQGRHQYSIDEVHSNFDIQAEISLTNVIGNFDKYSYAKQIDILHSIEDVSLQTKMYNKLEKLWDLECKYQIQQIDRNIEVVFITGESGTGKTTFAKHLLDELGYDYCISSSNNDVFQDYQGQQAIILDDLRDSSFSLTDLLKILDNNTNSSIKSRYNNKVFNGKMIIITSCKPLNKWYNSTESNVSSESLFQLYRRITLHVKVTEGTIFMCDKIDNRGRPVQAYINNMPNPILSLVKKYESKPKNYFEMMYNRFKRMDETKDRFATDEMFKSMGMSVLDEENDDGELPY